jgi:hypothetical protein
MYSDVIEGWCNAPLEPQQALRVARGGGDHRGWPKARGSGWGPPLVYELRHVGIDLVGVSPPSDDQATEAANDRR